MTCNVQTLIDFDVFGTGDELLLNRTCSQLTQPFEQFCLVPPPKRLANTPTCKAQLQDVLNAQYLFPKTTQGLVQSLEDLPIMYVSFPDQQTLETWIRDDMSPNTIQDFTRNKYRGLRPISSPEFVLGMATSSVQNQVFLLLSDAQSSVGKVQLYKADGFGLFRAQLEENGELIQTAYNTPGGVPQVACSEDGAIQAAMLDSTAFLWNALTNRWQRIDETSIRSLCVHDNILMLFGPNRVVFMLPSPRFAVGLEPYYVWQCLSLDRKKLFVCTVQSTSQVKIYTLDLQTRVILQTHVCSTTSQPLFRDTFYSAINVQNGSDLTTTLIYVTSGIALMQFSLTQSSATQSVVANRTITQFYNNSMWFENNQLHFADTPLSTYPTPQSMTSRMCMTRSNDDVWSFVNGTLQRFPLAQQRWSNTFDLYMSFDSRMDDENGAWHFRGSVDPPWYFGSISKDVNLSKDTPLPLFWNQSRHNRFRWIFDSVTNNDGTEFVHLVSHLERINDFALLTRSGGAQLFDDGNIVAGEWFQSNTHDKAGNPNQFALLNPILDHPVSSVNGIYLAYCNIQNNSRQIVVCYNVFNSSQFADWCNEQSTEFLTRALQQQGQFCLKNLSYDDVLNGTKQFADSRCECIPSEPMFQRLFPNAFSNISSYTATRTIQNIPCLSQKCADVFLLGQENTNVLNYASKQCKQNLVLCGQTLITTESLKIKDFKLGQDCGENNRCANNAQCPANSICFDGTCIQKCTTNEYCQQNLQDPLASCEKETGRCLYGIKSAKQSNAKTCWLVVAAVLFVVMLILIVVMLALYAKKKEIN